MGDPALTLVAREALLARPEEVARRLLGALVVSDLAPGRVVVRLTEVEAYAGEQDPGSHAYRGRTPRTEVMFGEAGHVYVYFSYGMHWCANVVCGPHGTASAVLLRAGEVVSGVDVARRRRATARADRDLARGPARLCAALGVTGTLDGADLLGHGPLLLCEGEPVPRTAVATGPRVGVGGAGAQTPWRFWVRGAPSVSTYRPHAPRRSRPESGAGESGS